MMQECGDVLSELAEISKRQSKGALRIQACPSNLPVLAFALLGAALLKQKKGQRRKQPL